MTNTIPITNSIQPINGLDVVEQVDKFYSTAFDHLLWTLGTLILLLGVVVPLAFYFFQKRQLTLKEKALAEELKSQFANSEAALRKENADFLAQEKIVLKQAIDNLQNELNSKINDTCGVIFAMQGNIFLEKGMQQAAFDFFSKTLRYAVDTQNPVSVQGTLRFLTIQALPKMAKNHFADEAAVIRFKNAIEDASKMKSNGLLNADIQEIRKAFAEAQKR
jgi:hypothetical protein